MNGKMALDSKVFFFGTPSLKSLLAVKISSLDVVNLHVAYNIEGEKTAHKT